MRPAARTRRAHPLRRAFALFLALGPIALVVACSSSNNATVGAGGACFLATDCAPGLVCVPQKSGARVCSSDLSQVTGDPPAPPGNGDAAPGEGGPDAPADGVNPPPPPPPTDGGTDTSLIDTSLE